MLVDRDGALLDCFSLALVLASELEVRGDEGVVQRGWLYLKCATGGASFRILKRAR
jgi:hypothetical protein